MPVLTLLRLDEKIRTSKDEPPPGCRLLGEVAGARADSMDFADHTYESGLAVMLLAAGRLQANHVTLDVTGPFGAHVPMFGRAFVCPPAPAAPTPTVAS